jgi:hypothetical protein
MFNSMWEFPAATSADAPTENQRRALAENSPAARRLTIGVRTLIVFGVFFLLVWATQHRAGAPSAAFGAFPDEPAHFVGGLMFHDYLSNSSWKDPIGYVRDYHLRLPFFALGVWPPLFYAIEGAWMEVFGERRESIMWLVAVIAAALATALYRVLEKQFDVGTALAGGAMFLLVPVVQWSECVVMADLICSLFAVFAIIFFARFMDSLRWYDSALFGLFAGLALLTKNSTYFLVLVPVIAIPAARRWDLLRSRALWIAPMVVTCLYLPWLVVSRPFLLLGIHGLELPGFWGIQRDYSVTLWRQTSFLLPLAAIGAGYLIISKRPIRPIAMCMLAVIPAVSIGIFAAKVPVQDRLLIVSYGAVIFLACECLAALLRSWKRKAVVLACLLTFGVLSWGQFRRPPVNHLRDAVAFLQARDGNHPGALVVPSSGEGPWIAELAQSEAKRPLRIILRPTKVFGDENWNGTNWHPFYTSATKLQVFFDRVPVKYCILAPPAAGRSYPHEQMLESVVGGNPEQWHLIFSGDGGFRVYENTHWTPDSEPVVLNEVKRLAPSYLR